MSGTLKTIVALMTGFLGLATLMSPTSGVSQTTASLHGTVRDQTGAVIAGATVSLADSATGVARTVTSSVEGFYDFERVESGIYQLQIESAGFEPFERKDVRLTSGDTAINAEMKVASLQQSIVVSGQHRVYFLASRGRILPEVGPGLRAMLRSSTGNYFVLTAPADAVAEYSREGKRIGQTPAKPTSDSAIVYGMSMSMDAQGRLYVVDRAANAVKIYGIDGQFLRKINVAAPVSVLALPDGDVAIAALSSERLVGVYDARGKEMRSFGEFPNTEQTIAGSFSNHGWFYGDTNGNIYYSLPSTPTPSIRKYDAYGYAAYELTVPSDEFGSRPFDPKVMLTLMAGTGFTMRASHTFAFDSEGNIVDAMGFNKGAGHPPGTNAEVSSDSPNTPTGSSRMAAMTTEGGPVPSGMMPGVTGSGAPAPAGMGNGNVGTGAGMGMAMMGNSGMPIMMSSAVRQVSGGIGGGMGGTGGGMPPGGGMKHPSTTDLSFSVLIHPKSSGSKSKPPIDAIGVDPQTQEVWVAVAGELIHFDKEGNRLGTYWLATYGQARVHPVAIIVEPTRLLIGIDPFGIFEYPRPDRPELLPADSPHGSPSSATKSFPE